MKSRSCRLFHDAITKHFSFASHRFGAAIKGETEVGRSGAPNYLLLSTLQSLQISLLERIEAEWPHA